MHKKELIVDGKDFDQADKVLIMLHGRGGTADDILGLAEHFLVDDFALVAPQANDNTWYPKSFMAAVAENEPYLSSALENLKELENELNKHGLKSENMYFFGFSQGACLMLEYITRNAKKYGGAVGIIGGLIGEKINKENYQSSFNGTRIFIGTSHPDPHVQLQRVEETVQILREKDAEVRLEIYENLGHTICQEEIEIANEYVFNRPLL